MKVTLTIDVQPDVDGLDRDELELELDSIVDGLGSVDAEAALADVLASYYSPVDGLTVTDARRTR